MSKAGTPCRTIALSPHTPSGLLYTVLRSSFHAPGASVIQELHSSLSLPMWDIWRKWCKPQPFIWTVDIICNGGCELLWLILGALPHLYTMHEKSRLGNRLTDRIKHYFLLKRTSSRSSFLIQELSFVTKRCHFPNLKNHWRCYSAFLELDADSAKRSHLDRAGSKRVFITKQNKKLI